MFTYVIERPDGSIYYQVADFITDIIDILGDGYEIVDIFPND